MKKFQTLVLGLASVAMLASCAKDVTKEEATKIAQDNYGKVTYASGKETIHLSASAKDENADAVKTLLINSLKTAGYYDGKVTEISNTSTYICTAEMIGAYPSDSKFQADGNKLFISYSGEQFKAIGLKGNVTQSTDENGYIISMTANLANTEDSVKVDISYTYTWTR